MRLLPGRAKRRAVGGRLTGLGGVVCGWLMLVAPAAGMDEAPPTEAELAARPWLVRTWSDRLITGSREDRAVVEVVLVRGGGDSLPILRRMLASRNEMLLERACEVLRRIGPVAVPVVVEALEHADPAVRWQAVGTLIDFAPDTDAALPALVRALDDCEPLVARDAVRALGALGGKAVAAVPELAERLRHPDEHVRIYAAEALAAVGPEAMAAVPTLAAALGDPVAGVRWAAAGTLGAIGPAAALTVPWLRQALGDETLMVRICAAGALGCIGPGAVSAVEDLRAAGADPAMRAETDWALARIIGEAPERPAEMPLARIDSATGAEDAGGDPPEDWNMKTGGHIAWSARLGNDTFGRPVVADGIVYVGTDNSRPRDRKLTDECGVLMAFRASDGKFLWQDAAPRVERGMREFLLPATTSAPLIKDGLLFYVTAECQLRCLDARTGERRWELDMCERLGVFPHEASNSEVAVAGDLLVVATANGRNEGHTRVPAPRAPSLIAVEKRSGTVVWRAVGAGEGILHGQWCSPAVAEVNGRSQILHGGGDGWLRAYDAASGRELWRFDGNPKGAAWRPRPEVFSRSPIIATPVVHGGRVLIAMGQDPSHGDGPSLVHAVNPNGQGDVTSSRRLWTSREVGRVVGTPVAVDGLLFIGDLGGLVHCLDAATGAVVWRHATDAPIWGCLLHAGGRIYAGNTDGLMTVLAAGRARKVLARIEMGAPLYARPALAGDDLYLATANRLYRIARPSRRPAGGS